MLLLHVFHDEPSFLVSISIFGGVTFPKTQHLPGGPALKGRPTLTIQLTAGSPTGKKNLRMLVGNNPLEWCFKKSSQFDGYGLIDFFFGLAWLAGFFGGGVTTSLPSRQNPAKGEVEELPIYNTEPPKKKNREPPLRNPRKSVPKGFGWIVFQGFCCHDFREGKFFFM